MAKSSQQADIPLPRSAGRIEAGKPGPTIPVTRPVLQRLFMAAASERQQEIWVRDDSELLVTASRTVVTLAEGLVLVRVPVMCREVGTTTVEIPIAVGSKERPAGMVAATEDLPRGDARLMALWGESLIAFAWRTLLKVAAQAAAGVGVDEDGNGLIPIAMSASPDELLIYTLARHAFDRVRP